MKRSLISLLLYCLVIILSHCEKASTTNHENDDPKTSPADKVSGTFKGTGMALPDNINLGTYKGCVEPPAWRNNFLIGSAEVIISKQNDSTISFTISGVPFSVRSYSNIHIKENNGVIDLGVGNYVEDTKYLNLSLNTAPGVFTGSPACLQGMPYYSGWSPLNDNNFVYFTHGRNDFTGYKQ